MRTTRSSPVCGSTCLSPRRPFTRQRTRLGPAARLIPLERCLPGDAVPANANGGPAAGIDRPAAGFRRVRSCSSVWAAAAWAWYGRPPGPLKRPVADKMLRAPRSIGPELDLFRLEAEAVAPAAHTNMVQIYEVDQVGGRPYIAWSLEGGSLAQR